MSLRPAKDPFSIFHLLKKLILLMFDTTCLKSSNRMLAFRKRWYTTHGLCVWLSAGSLAHMRPRDQPWTLGNIPKAWTQPTVQWRHCLVRTLLVTIWPKISPVYQTPWGKSGSKSSRKWFAYFVYVGVVIKWFSWLNHRQDGTSEDEHILSPPSAETKLSP